jgi:hypothetical protein
MPDTASPLILVLVRDLLFASKISSAAQAAGCSLKLIRDPAKLPEEPGRMLIVDLNLTGGIDAASEWKARHSGHITGFVGHTDTATIAQAQKAGIDRILTRGQFVSMLPELLR